MPSYKIFALYPLLILLLLTGCLSLAEDISPPPGAELPAPVLQNTPAPQTITEVSLPAQPGNPSRGAPIYAEKCAPCHGDTGMGDGEMAQNIPGGVPEISSFEIIRQATPLEWYRIVSEGNPDPNRIMPAFNSLTDAQRWDVVAYAFTLSASPEIITQGQELFSQNCAECHGQDGGQGAIDLKDHQWMSAQSAVDLFEAITIGHGEMPGFDDLDEDDRWVLTAYLRSLSFAAIQTNTETEISEEEAKPEDSGDPSEIQPEAPIQGEISSDGITDIRVKIVNGTAGAELPSDLEITLRGYDNMTEVYTQTSKTNGGDEVLFSGIEVPEGRLYFATMKYGNATYGSDIHTTAGEENIRELEITYYQPVSDPSILSVDRLHVFVNFIDEKTIEVYQLYIFTNLTDRVLVPAVSGQPAISFTIPTEAQNFNVEENMSMLYMKTSDGFGIINIYPDADQYQTLFSFQLPYARKLDLDLPIGMDAKAIVVMVPDIGVDIKSDQLVEMGAQAIEGSSFIMFNGSNLATGQTLSMEISGRPKLEGTQIVSNLEGNHQNLVIGLAVFGIALIASGIYLWRRNRTAGDDWLEDDIDVEPIEETSDDVIDAIIALDDQYKNGELPEGAYRQRRAELKERLRMLVG